MEHSYQAHVALGTAKTYFDKGFEAQKEGDFLAALNCYQKSIETHASAEAYCYMGWTYSFLGQYEKAIRSCMKAIEVDPDFGNPYNDIGAYLIELGRFEEALPWLRKATRAHRYDCVHYPWYNMGKVFERTGRLMQAREAYARALSIYKGYPLAVDSLLRVMSQLN
jgi:tetratricopeptide (TPR) repeat protein